MLYGMPTLVECGDIAETVEVAKKYGIDFTCRSGHLRENQNCR